MRLLQRRQLQSPPISCGIARTHGPVGRPTRERRQIADARVAGKRCSRVVAAPWRSSRVHRVREKASYVPGISVGRINQSRLCLFGLWDGIAFAERQKWSCKWLDEFCRGAGRCSGGHSTSTHLTAGALSGAFAASVTQPLDVVKTRMQAEPVERRQLPRYTGVRQALRVIATEEGARGLFVGLAPSVLALVPALSSFFTVYTSTKRWAFGVDPNGRGDTPLASGVSAGTAWVVTAMLTNPLWVVRTRIITQILREGKGHARHRSRGGIPRPIPGHGGGHGRLPGRERAVCTLRADEVHAAVGVVSVVAAERGVSGGGVLGELFRQPNGVLPAGGSSDANTEMLAREGLRSFYRGLMPSMLRTVPNSAAALVSYEFFLSMLT
eukprot:ctg_2267.g609